MSRRSNGQPIDINATLRGSPETEAIRREPGTKPEHSDIEHSWRKPGEPPSEIPTVWKTICTLELRGLTHTQIAAELRFSPQGVGNIIRDPRYRDYVRRVLGDMDDEFLRMKPLAFRALEGGLKAIDQDVALRASAQWFKAAGFGGFGTGASYGKPPATAEEVASRLLNQVNVQVNVTTVGASPSPGEQSDGGPDQPVPTGDPQRGSST